MVDSPSTSPPTKKSKLAETSDDKNSEKDNFQEEDAENNCSICLQPMEDRTVIPTCSHDFCFDCLLIWTAQSRRCPLCSQTIGEYVIHDIRSRYDYRKHHLAPLAPKSPQSALPIRGSTSMSARNMARRRRRERERDRYRDELNEQDKLELSIATRRWIYKHDLYAKHVASNTFTKYRPYPTPAQFAASPDLISRTTTFLRRELQVWHGLDVEFLTNLIISLMKAIDIRSESAVKLISEFLDMDVPYQPGSRHVNAEHFAHEVYSYVRSPYRDLFVYDSVAQYDRPADGSVPPSARELNTRWREHSVERARSPETFVQGSSSATRDYQEESAATHREQENHQHNRSSGRRSLTGPTSGSVQPISIASSSSSENIRESTQVNVPAGKGKRKDVSQESWEHPSTKPPKSRTNITTTNNGQTGSSSSTPSLHTSEEHKGKRKPTGSIPCQAGDALRTSSGNAALSTSYSKMDSDKKTVISSSKSRRQQLFLGSVQAHLHSKSSKLKPEETPPINHEKQSRPHQRLSLLGRISVINTDGAHQSTTTRTVHSRSQEDYDHGEISEGESRVSCNDNVIVSSLESYKRSQPSSSLHISNQDNYNPSRLVVADDHKGCSQDMPSKSGTTSSHRFPTRASNVRSINTSVITEDQFDVLHVGPSPCIYTSVDTHAPPISTPIMMDQGSRDTPRLDVPLKLLSRLEKGKKQVREISNLKIANRVLNQFANEESRNRPPFDHALSTMDPLQSGQKNGTTNVEVKKHLQPSNQDCRDNDGEDLDPVSELDSDALEAKLKMRMRLRAKLAAERRLQESTE